jgi:riboflavin kinase / FMN adenylyltransferase
MSESSPRAGRPALQIRREASALPRGTAACVGAFDGLHLGHRALLDRARAQGGPLALVTFDPHPQRLLAPDRPLELLLAPDQRAHLAGALGVEQLVLLPFDHAMSTMSPEAFVRSQLLEGLAPSTVVVGSDFRFGAGRRGGTAELAALLAPAGIVCEVVPPVPMPASLRSEDGDGDKLGSSAIRAAIVAGHIERAALMLARPHALLGVVEHGDHRGRTIGFPTANLRVDEGCVPAAGVYAGWATVWPPGHDDLRAPMPTVINIGTRPTFGGAEPTVRIEAHLLDRALGDRLYGARMELWLTERLRDEQRFAGVEALVAQIGRDADRARATLGEVAPAAVLRAPASADGTLP